MLGTPLTDVQVHHAENVLLQPSPGLMLWTLITFGLTLFVLTKWVFGPVGRMIEKRRAEVQNSLEEATRSRDEAVTLLEEYKVRLAEAHKEADALRERGRKEGERRSHEIVGEAQQNRERILADAQVQLDAQTRSAVSGLRNDMVDIAMDAASRATRGALSESDHRRLIEQAIDEADLSRLSRS